MYTTESKESMAPEFDKIRTFDDLLNSGRSIPIFKSNYRLYHTLRRNKWELTEEEKERAKEFYGEKYDPNPIDPTFKRIFTTTQFSDEDTEDIYDNMILEEEFMNARMRYFKEKHPLSRIQKPPQGTTAREHTELIEDAKLLVANSYGFGFVLSLGVSFLQAFHDTPAYSPRMKGTSVRLIMNTLTRTTLWKGTIGVGTILYILQSIPYGRVLLPEQREILHGEPFHPLRFLFMRPGGNPWDERRPYVLFTEEDKVK